MHDQRESCDILHTVSGYGRQASELWLGGSMRRLIATMIVVVVLCLGTGAPAVAQIDGVMSAVNSAVREAQRALTSKQRQRRFRRQAPFDPSILPPPPVANPARIGRRLALRKSLVDTPTPPRIAQGGPPPGAPLDSAKQPASDTTTRPPAAASETKPQPQPDVWTTAEIEKAQALCRRSLRKIKANLEPVAAIKKGPCGTAAPYKLASIGKQDPVVFSPQPVVNCRMIAALDKWLKKGLQPLAIKHLGAGIKRVSVMSSYSCRNAYGRTSTKLSEHGLANALDIGGFVTTNGQSIRLLTDWGPTQRDIIAEAKRLQEQRERALAQQRSEAQSSGKTSNTQSRVDGQISRIVESNARDTRQPSQSRKTTTAALAQQTSKAIRFPAADQGPPPLPVRRPSLKERARWAEEDRVRRAARRARVQRNKYRNELNNFLSERSNLGGPKSGTPAPASQRRPATSTPKATFLRAAHRSACKIFGTVLGPEANDAHRNHFHVDMAHRKYRNYCR
ncbi:MAG: extensin family protein [Hyphomicrobiaceae bacterium]